MPGLLDFFTSNDPAQQQGLLAAAAQMMQASGPSRMPVSLSQVIGSGLGAYQQGQQAYQDRQQQQLLASLKLRGLQGELDDQELARKQRRDIEAAARNAVQAPEQQALALGGGPTVENAARIPEMKGGFDTEGFLSRVMAIDPLKALELRKSLAKAGPKFDSGITWVNGPNGQPVAVRTADDGSIKQIDGLSPRDKLELANLGGKDVAYNPFALQPGQTFQRTMTPDGAAADSRARERLSFDKSQVGKPVFNAEAGGFVLPPSAANPGGKLLPVAGVGGKAPTEFQGKSAAFGLRATEADKIIRELSSEGSTGFGLVDNTRPGAIKGIAESIPLIGGGLGTAVNALPEWAGAPNSKQQRAEQAQRDFINAVLRQESGAAIGASEFDNARQQYFAQPGDGPAVIAQKARARQLAIQGLQANAGKAALTAPAATGHWSITKVE